MPFKKNHDLSLLILRLVAGGFMLTHGIPKLMKLFAGGEIMFPDPIGVGATASLILAVFSEVICAGALVIGFKTRLAAIPLAITIFVAAFIVHLDDPFGKKEMALLYLAMYVVLMIGGGGKYSLGIKKS